MTSLILALFVALAVLPSGARAAATKPADTVRGFYDVLLNVMKSGPTLGPRGRYETLEPVIGQIFDLSYMTRAVVGPVWGGLSEAQQRQATGAFGRYVAATYADRFGAYSGQTLQVTDERPRAADAIVDSRIIRADGKPVAIRYVLHQNAGNWQVADIYLDGTISELATRRSEFSSILRQQGIDGLIAVLNRKADALISSAG